MAKALVVYGSTTGNTEIAATRIADILQQSGVTVTVKNVIDAKVKEIGNGYDITLLGVSTWGDDSIEFQEDFEPFYEQLDEARVEGRKVALFGCGDSSYEFFCGAVDELEAKMQSLEAIIVNTPLRIDGSPDDADADIVAWARNVSELI